MKVSYISHSGSDRMVVAEKETKHALAIKEAYRRGYRATELGEIISPSKLALKCSPRGKQRYGSFTLNQFPVKPFRIQTHKFAAYCFFGEAALVSEIHVRHLNGNRADNSKANLRLGTASQNEMDKDPESRKNTAKKARAAQGKAAKNRKLNETQLAEIAKFYTSLEGKKAPQGSIKALGKKLGVSRSAINRASRGLTYAN